MSCIVKTCIGNCELSSLLQEIKKDIFLLYDETSVKNIDDLISEISVKYQLKYGIMINIYDMSISYDNKYKNISPLIKNIEREVVAI